MYTKRDLHILVDLWRGNEYILGGENQFKLIKWKYAEHRMCKITLDYPLNKIFIITRFKLECIQVPQKYTMILNSIYISPRNSSSLRGTYLIAISYI